MKVLLTGYAGLLGRHIARALKREGYTVRVVLHQRTVTRKDFRSEADELLWGSLDDPLVLKAAVQGVDAVVHSAWKFSRQTAARPTVNELVTESIARECLREGVRQFAFISSVAVYGMKAQNGTPVSEESPLVPDSEGFIYPAEKVRTESMLRSLQRGPMQLGMFRPGPIFDDGKSPVKKVIRLLGKNLAIGFGTGRNAMPYIHAADVADAVVRWLRSGRDGAVYNITPAICMRHREWYVAWGRMHGLKLRPVFLRRCVMRFLAWIATLLKRILGKPGRVDVDYALAAASRDVRYANTRAKEELGWNPSLTDEYCS